MNKYENENIEFKREYVDDIKKIIVSFANTNGGELYIGIEDDGTPVGISSADEVILKVSNSIRDTIKPDLTMFISYESKIIGNKSIVVVSVQKGTATPY
ncbi:ATP-binding protein, partial [Cutibacterium acnes]